VLNSKELFSAEFLPDSSEKQRYDLPSIINCIDSEINKGSFEKA
jgi:hypothetical protein